MTTDVIALTRRMPDAWSLMAGLMAGGPDTQVAPRGEDAVLQLFDAQGRPLVSIESPVLVRSPHEISRLLGAEALDAALRGLEGSPRPGGQGGVEPTPLWWTEVRAATGARGGGRLAGVIATRLAAQLGGTVWPSGAWVETYGATVTDVTATSAATTDEPAVDVLTDHAVVVIQDRHTIAMTSWLADAFRAAERGDRALQIVTPPHARLTLPVRTVLSGLPNRWVVQDGKGGYYDGLSGSELHWQDGRFTANGTPAQAFVAELRDAGEAGQQLVLSFRTRHTADTDLLLGGAVEEVWRHFTGEQPAGWGTAEPATSPWSRQELTALVRDRAPQPSWLVAVGGPDQPALATLQVSRTTGGVEEDVTLALGYPPQAPLPTDDLPKLAEKLVARHGLVSMLIQQRTARSDLAVPPRLEIPPLPLAFVLGREGVDEVGLTVARRPPLPEPPRQLGRAGAAGFYYPLGDGAWQEWEQLMTHLLGSNGDAAAEPADDN